MSELKIPIRDKANEVIARLLKETTLSRDDILNMFINEGFDSYFFCGDYEDLLSYISEYVKPSNKRKQ